MLKTSDIEKCDSVEKKRKLILKERIKCAKDYKYLIETYFEVDAAGEILPFKLYNYQVRTLNDYIAYTNNITMKTRQMGFTTFTAAYIACEMINNSNYKALVISKTANDAMEFVRKIKGFLDGARKKTKISNKRGSKSWLIPDYKDGYNNKKSFHLENSSFVESQGNSDDSGRGFSALSIIIVDESIDNSLIMCELSGVEQQNEIAEIYNKLKAFEISKSENLLFLEDKKHEIISKLQVNQKGCVLDFDNIKSQDTSEIVKNNLGIKILTPNEGYVEFDAIKKISVKTKVTLELYNSTSISTSQYHRLNTPNGYKYVKDINEGDYVLLKEMPIKVFSKKIEHGNFEMYDILGVGTKAEFLVNNIQSHNCAFIDRKSPERMNEIWAAVGPALATTKGKSIMISTPNGSSGWYYDTYVNADQMGFNIIRAHWTEHPIYSQGMYKWVKDNEKVGGGYVKFLNDVWPETLQNPMTKKIEKVPKTSYQFICDGKIRSPWYDYESKKLGKRKTARELDCSFMGTGGEVLSEEVLLEMDLYARGCTFHSVYKKGFLAKYKEFELPNEDYHYIVSCDTMTGDGRDYTTAVILKVTRDKIKIVGTLKGQILPKYFAKSVKELAKRFNNAIIVIEHQGGGSTTLQELKEMKVPKIFYSTLVQNDESKGGKKRKIGLWQNETTRTKGGDELESLLEERELEIPCVDLANEFKTWIWSKQGRRDHAAGKNDDLIMGLQNAIYYWKYIYKKMVNRSEVSNRMFEIQVNEFSDYDEMTDPFFEEKKQRLVNKNKINRTKQKKDGKVIPKFF